MNTEQELSRSIGIIFAGFLLGAFMAFFAVKCTDSTETETKPIKGKFRSNKIKNTPISAVATTEKTRGANRFVLRGQDLSNSENTFLQKQIDSLLNENQKLVDAFAAAPIAKKDSLYNKAIELNEYSKSFENEFLKADIKGVARGTVESIVLNYEILPQPVKQKNHLYIGFTVGNTVQFDKPVFSAGLGYQLRKGSIIRLGYDSDKLFFLGYDLKVF
ncbi:hypothetical protein BWK60_01905 [Flavobacterium covae]|uniref:hypothetical protein n=1 Tax=Flavobacterium covae TaxID=2906076 RepID=UPI000B4CEE97|nr:hypothetical protein [Flavobacterium covae]OWP87767.1 hypothetical protein BWK60_01905 [Flavobacterium covae]